MVAIRFIAASLIMLVCQFCFAGFPVDHIARVDAGSPASNVANERLLQQASTIKVVFLNPAYQDDFWWSTCTEFMRAAADSFGMHLTVYYADRSPANIIEQAQRALETDKPDFIVTQNLKGTAPAIIDLAAKSGVKVMLFNSTLSDAEAARMGAPREKYPNWIGALIPDDAQAGYDLVDYLVRQARKLRAADSSQRIQMIALGGARADASAMERNKGLLRYLREHPKDVILNRGHVLPADWHAGKARRIFGLAYRMFPRTRVVWAANDNMAIGALLMAQEEAGVDVAKSLAIGGIDWNPENLQAIKRGELAASFGGHFTQGAWAIILLHDYVKGVDFSSEGLVIRQKMELISRDNIMRMAPALMNRNAAKIRAIDFSRFSKAANPAVQRYHISSDALLEQLNP